MERRRQKEKFLKVNQTKKTKIIKSTYNTGNTSIEIRNTKTEIIKNTPKGKDTDEKESSFKSTITTRVSLPKKQRFQSLPKSTN